MKQIINKNTFSNIKKKLFPQKIGSSESADLFGFGLKEMKKSCKKLDAPWVTIQPFPLEETNINELFSKIPENGISQEEVISGVVKKFFNGIPNWRSPELQYNICAPVNVTAQALMSLAQEYNIHNINNNFSGNCLLAENLVSGMMADLVGIERKKVKALFSFGGTASNLYAMKLAIHKALPSAGKTGISPNIFMMITSGAHFSHKTAADWLGIGTDHLVVIESDNECRSIIKDAENKAQKIIENGGVIAGFLLNGGTLYDAAIDDIPGFISLRERLIQKYKLNYAPHIHLDSVIGWVWLMFNGYDFNKNSLKIPLEDLQKIKIQFDRVYKIRLADSWGVDFHKALGGCPTPCGLFVSNKGNELLLLSKSRRGVCDTHQLGGDWSIDDPSDITLETSRSAGPSLAAIGSMLTMGMNGFRSFIANQIFATRIFRNKIPKETAFLVGNPNSLGFNVMLVISPKDILGTKKQNWESFLSLVENNENLLNNLNNELKNFYDWCLKEGDNYANLLGCSFSRSFIQTKFGKNISGLKYCMVSPHTDKKAIEKEIKKLNERFKKFKKIKSNEEKN
jgi:L-2,4-diaminobutyrate decarboxylase